MLNYAFFGIRTYTTMNLEKLSCAVPNNWIKVIPTKMSI